MVYNIITKYYGEQFVSGSNSHFSVTRSYKDIQNLYKYLNLSYQKHGVIIPPPPPKANLSIVDTVQTAGAKNLTASAASRSIDKKCVALDRYAHCLKITQNVAFEFLNIGIFHQFFGNLMNF